MAPLLLVDDDEIILDTLTELFSGEHQCDTARTAEDALRQLESQDYDLVITDVSMPGMSGEDLLGFIKKYRPKTPVLFITGSLDREYAERLIKRGAFNYSLKPFRLEELEGKAGRALEYRKRNVA